MPPKKRKAATEAAEAPEALMPATPPTKAMRGRPKRADTTAASSRPKRSAPVAIDEPQAKKAKPSTTTTRAAKPTVAAEPEVAPKRRGRKPKAPQTEAAEPAKADAKSGGKNTKATANGTKKLGKSEVAPRRGRSAAVQLDEELTDTVEAAAPKTRAPIRGTKRTAGTAAEEAPKTPVKRAKASTKKSTQDVSVEVPNAAEDDGAEVDGMDEVEEEAHDDEAASDARSYWLMKAEPNSRMENGVDVRFSIDDLRAATAPEPWDGEYTSACVARTFTDTVQS